MRPLLNDWLSDLCAEFKLRPETRFLAVNIVERYLSCAQVSRHRLQLLGAAAVLIAAKFEEVTTPSLTKLAWLMAGEFSEREITSTECSVLSVLGFQILCPTAAHFLSHIVAYSSTAWASSQIRLAWKILDMALLDECSLRFLPSRVAFSALFVACKAYDPRSAADVFADFVADSSYLVVAFDALGLDVEVEVCGKELQRISNAGLRRPLQEARRQRDEQSNTE